LNAASNHLLLLHLCVLLGGERLRRGRALRGRVISVILVSPVLQFEHLLQRLCPLDAAALILSVSMLRAVVALVLI